MTKKLTFLAFALIFYNLHSQITDFSKLTYGKLIYYTPLFYPGSCNPDEYFFLFKKGKTLNKGDVYEYIILNQNLEKTQSNSFSEETEVNLLQEITGQNKNGKILLTIKENGYSNEGKKIKNYWYRLIDTKKNTISDPFFIDINNEFSGIKKNGKGNNKNDLYFSFDPIGNGYKFQTWDWPYALCYYENLEIENQPLWCLKNSRENKNTKTHFNKFDIYEVDNKNNIALLKELKVKRKTGDTHQKVLNIKFNLINLKNNNYISTLNIPELENKESVLKLLSKSESAFNIQGIIKNNYFIAENLKLKDHARPESYSLDYYYTKTGKKIKSDVFNLKDISPYINFDKEFNILENDKKNGFLKFISKHEFNDGRLVLIFETIKNTDFNKQYKTVRFGNYIFIELKDNLKATKLASSNLIDRIISDKKEREKLLENFQEYFSKTGYNPSESTFGSVNFQLEDLKFIKKLQNNSILVFYSQSNTEETKPASLSCIRYKDGHVNKLPDIPLPVDDGETYSFLETKDEYILLMKEYENKNKLPILQLIKIKTDN